MSNPIVLDYSTATITVQASASVTAGSYSTGAQTVITNTTAGNGEGAYALHLVLNISSGTSSTGGTAELYQEAGHSTSAWCEPELIRTITASTLDGKNHSAWVYAMPKYAKYKIKAVTRGFKASLAALPVKQKVN